MYATELAAKRRTKDDLLRHSSASPLPDARRAKFGGLAYFPADEDYRVAGLGLEPVAAGEDGPFAIVTSDGRSRMARRIGRPRFAMDGSQLELTAYAFGAAAGDGALFVPLRDGTSGTESYAAGRYLDIEPEPDGSYVLDFNLAYSPLCAYSDSSSCPLPPPENWLPVRITAGERVEDGPHDDPASRSQP